jgi:hypothetical protein
MRIFVLFLLICFNISAQDERYFRQIYSGELTNKEEKIDNFKLVVDSPEHHIDLNRDGLDERLVYSKKDGTDYLKIMDYSGRAIFETPFQSHSRFGRIYKIYLKTISPSTDVLVLFYYEGENKSARFEASARLYFISIDNKNLKTLTMFKGPHYFHEFENVRDVYWLRDLAVNIYDYNQDGVKEISVSFNKISRVYFYQNRGLWVQI